MIDVRVCCQMRQLLGVGLELLLPRVVPAVVDEKADGIPAATQDVHQRQQGDHQQHVGVHDPVLEKLAAELELPHHDEHAVHGQQVGHIDVVIMHQFGIHDPQREECQQLRHPPVLQVLPPNCLEVRHENAVCVVEASHQAGDNGEEEEDCEEGVEPPVVHRPRGVVEGQRHRRPDEVVQRNHRHGPPQGLREPGVGEQPILPH
mmetsp:Transcript_4337/g.8915  ORF Transcript_4337/g.8915 Transcript_4337/m.8915 type:complete len:204 (+) Transcript_4337:226-837(+)